MRKSVGALYRARRVIHALTLASLALLCGQARAEQASFDTGRTDKKLVIEATIEGRPIDASGQVRVVLRDAKGTVTAAVTNLEVSAEAPDKPPAGVIPASRITVEEKNIDAGLATPLTVSVKGIDRPGIYRGKITFHLPVVPAAPAQPASGQPAPAQPAPGAAPAPVTTTEVALELRVTVKPQIESPDTTVAVGFSNCTWWCEFAEFLSPGSTSGAETSVVVTNKSPAPVAITGVIDVKGSTRTNAAKSVSAKNPGEKPITVEAGGRQRIYFDFPSKEFVADHFTGTAVITAAVPGQPTSAGVGSDGALTYANRTVLSIPVTVDVRDSAMWAFLAILAGVLAGRLGKIFGSAARNARVELFMQKTSLESKIDDLQESDDPQEPKVKLYCRKQLEDIWSHILKEDATDPKFKQQLADLDQEVQLFAKLIELRDQARKMPESDTRKAAIQSYLKTAMDSLMATPARLGDAKTALDAADKKAHEPAAQPKGLVPDQFLYSFDETVADVMRGIEDRQKAEDRRKSRKGRILGCMNRLLLFISGIDTTETIEFQVFFVRPLVWAATVIALSFYGLWLLYGGTGHASFGAGGIPDYITLFLWGIAAQTVGMTLADIKFTR
jgi:hypothetical protein